jgi:hypothetical protein
VRSGSPDRQVLSSKTMYRHGGRWRNSWKCTVLRSLRPRPPRKGSPALKANRFVPAIVDLRLKRGSGRDVVLAAPGDVPVIIFSGVPSELSELERVRPRTRLIEKPYSLGLLVETLEEMLTESANIRS